MVFEVLQWFIVFESWEVTKGCSKSLKSAPLETYVSLKVGWCNKLLPIVYSQQWVETVKIRINASTSLLSFQVRPRGTVTKWT